MGYVVFGTTVVVGAVTHYLLPHLRKENTCLCTVEPCIKSQEYNQFEVTGTVACGTCPFIACRRRDAEGVGAREAAPAVCIGGEKRSLPTDLLVCHWRDHRVLWGEVWGIVSCHWSLVSCFCLV